MSDIDWTLDHGSKYAYDKMHLDEGYSETPIDWARFAALGVLADLCDRGGIKHELRDIENDAEIAEEIVESLTAIIRRAHERMAPR